MRSLLLAMPLIIFGAVSGFGQTATSLTLNGDPSNRIDLVILGDGYTADELVKFATDATNLQQHIFGQEPFREYERYFNVWRVDVASAESGSDHPERDPPVARETAFDSTYNCADIQRLICIDYSKVQVALSDVPLVQRDYVLMIVNDDQPGGSGGTIAVMAANQISTEVALHELGHSMASLADEYTSSPPKCVNDVEPFQVNVTMETDPASIKWRAWIDAGTAIPTESSENGVPGLYLGAKYCTEGLYRPTFNSKMRSLGRPFEQINEEQFIRSFYSSVSPVDSVQPTATTETIKTGQRRIFSVTTLQPATHDLDVSWTVDGAVAGLGLSYVFDSTGLVGEHVLTVVVSDPTSKVRSDPDMLLRGQQSWVITVVGALDFAHFANGDGITSDMVFVNVAIHPIWPILYFYDKGGNLIAPESVVDLTGDLEITEDGALTVQTEMEPLGELTISTHGRGEVSGSVKVVSDGPIGGVLRFDLPGIGVAGVGASQPVRDALFPARREGGGISTAAAIHNIEEEAIVVSCSLMSGGVVLEEMEISLAAYGQEAQFIEEMFTTTDTSNFVGLVRCTGPGRFTGVAVEMDAGNRIFTTLPVVPVARTGGEGQEAGLDFAHFANGAGIVSDLVLVNLSTQPSGPGPTPFHAVIPATRPALYFYDQEGQPIDPESVVDLTGDLEVTEDGALTVQTEMEPLGELTISTHGRGEGVSGSVQVVSDGPIGGVLRFDLPGTGVAGVGASPPVRDALFPARRQEGGIRTGVALRNPGEEAMGVSCRLMKDGAVLEEVDIHLEANGQEARFIEEVFTATDTSDFVGSVRCTAPEGRLFTGVAVELDAGNRIFTTLPVVPVVVSLSFLGTMGE